MERLIEEVRKYPILYDQKHEKYWNAEYKERVWNTIATHLRINSGQECKKKWASIRDQFRRTLQKRKNASGQAAATFRKYKYEDLLQFLLPHVAERDTISNVADSEEITDNTLSADATPKEEVIDGDEPESVEEYIQEEPEIQTQKTKKEVLCINSSIYNPKFVKPGLNRKRQSPSNPQETASSQLRTYILSESKRQTQSQDVARIEAEKHPDDAFLAAIAPPLKSLNPIFLNEAKGRIFSVVQEYEMKQLLASQETISAIPCNQFSPSPASSPAFAPSPQSSGSIYSVSTPHASPEHWNLDNADDIV